MLIQHGKHTCLQDWYWGEGGAISVTFLEEQWEDRLSPVLVNTLMAFASVIIAFMTTSSEKQDLHVALTCSVFGIATWWGHRNKTLEEKGWEWRLSKFPLSAYCHISGHADLVYINHPKALVARKVYHTVKYSCEMDGWTTEKKEKSSSLEREEQGWRKMWMFPIHRIFFVISYFLCN